MNNEIPVPIPAASQALVKIRAFGLNRMDLMQREGKYNVPPQAGRILGVEFSGVIVALGEGGDAGDFRVGDEVFGLAYGGMYIQYSYLTAETSDFHFYPHFQGRTTTDRWVI